MTRAYRLHTIREGLTAHLDTADLLMPGQRLRLVDDERLWTVVTSTSSVIVPVPAQVRTIAALVD